MVEIIKRDRYVIEAQVPGEEGKEIVGPLLISELDRRADLHWRAEELAEKVFLSGVLAKIFEVPNAIDCLKLVMQGETEKSRLVLGESSNERDQELWLEFQIACQVWVNLLLGGVKEEDEATLK